LSDSILTLRCPGRGCGTAFFDFEGCFALTCSVCRTAFCAWCLKRCGRDAHDHVRRCGSNRSPDRGFYGTEAQFCDAQRERRTQLLKERLRRVQPALRAPLLDALHAELDGAAMPSAAALRQYCDALPDAPAAAGRAA
jgi:hypothetical protein